MRWWTSRWRPAPWGIVGSEGLPRVELRILVMVRLSVVVVLLSLALALAVIREVGGIVGVLGALLLSRVRGVPGPHGVDEMGTRDGRNNDAKAGSGDSGSCLASSGVDPGSGGDSPCGGGGPGPLLASRPVRGQRLGRLGGWGGLGNHCKDVRRVSEVGGGGGMTCVDSVGGSECSAERVPDPSDEEERRTSTVSGDASAVGSDDGHYLDYSCGGPGSGRGSPRGGRGPGSPVASRPVRGQRLGSVEGWGGLRNHCEDVVRCGNGHDGLDGGLGDVVVHGVKGTGVSLGLSFVTWNCAGLFGHAPRDGIGRKR